MHPHRASQLNPNLQYRCFDVRALDDASDGFDGHASTFWAVDSYKTAMAPGSFRKTLKERADRIPLLWQHWPDQPIGKPTELKEDKSGLTFKAQVSTGTTTGAEAMTLLRDGVPLGMSFGFQTMKKRSAEEGDPLDFSQMPNLKRDDVEVITEVKLWEISLVTFPANEAAAISAVRSELETDAITTLLDAIRADDLDEGRAVLITQLVAAWGERAGAGPDHSTPEQARRNRDIDVSLALRKMEGLLSGDYSWA